MPLSLPLSHQPVTCQPIIVSNMSYKLVIDKHVQHVTITNTQPFPLTCIIYQKHVSTRFPTSPTHASTKHVPRSPTYHHKISVSSMYEVMYQMINLYHTKHQTFTTTYTIPHINFVP
jgi:hypothetical protein